MTGSLQEKSGKFYMVLNTQVSGKRKLKWISTGLTVKGNKRRAEQMLRETLQTYESGQKKATPDILFADYIRSWLDCDRRRVDEVTYQGNEKLALCHVVPWFEKQGVQLADVTLELLQQYADEKASYGRKDGKGGLSPRSLRLHKNILYQALTEAVKGGLLPSNPCQYVVLPKSVRYESHFYTAEKENRRPYSPDYITKKFPALLKAHGMPHADIRMTANIYGHLDVSRKQIMAAKLAGDLSALC